jgi:hypothetical protein
MKKFEEADSRLWRLSFCEESRGFIWRCTGRVRHAKAEGKRRADNDNTLRFAETQRVPETLGPRNRAPVGVE